MKLTRKHKLILAVIVAAGLIYVVHKKCPGCQKRFAALKSKVTG